MLHPLGRAEQLYGCLFGFNECHVLRPLRLRRDGSIIAGGRRPSLGFLTHNGSAYFYAVARRLRSATSAIAETSNTAAPTIAPTRSRLRPLVACASGDAASAGPGAGDGCTVAVAAGLGDG